ncbi:16S rRNA (cytosine(1402)-N(4))-methyltransferase RsmH [Desulfobulbus rhabdoformis]|uniref:16S rRNA (cytosine(1402)-N(4))-methyltransferase RsmH n=1 Tax=Desulfobulbus rhabdoformis TaxID=34032 RepID=UPI00196423A0|nr:16S rRNA (cytosine(1402)-N(4))-methyltransferase RsmH [Desulfobulbus rhabdoformis]MBM9613299.1 16S rRNA (cytosine(1402)-N(4))-methyltransferase RsmH [Desulfobulbus rhabdoformis]
MPQDQYPIHVPVLLEEVLEGLLPASGGLYVDGTLGLGGHSEALLKRSGPAGRVVGFEWDEDAVSAGNLSRYGDRFTLIHASYADLVPELQQRGLHPINGLTADLGVSSLQLDRAERGFSFRTDGELDMRMDRRRPLNAAQLVAQAPEEQLADIFYHYGEERQARRIAKFVVNARQQEPITTTGQLASIVAEAVPRRFHPPKIHVATKVFQALRIAVNGELDNVTQLLNSAPEVLAVGARVAIITFHSLEDRIVKQIFQKNPAYKVITKRPVEPTTEEMQHNPRARSAKLRVAERV